MLTKGEIENSVASFFMQSPLRFLQGDQKLRAFNIFYKEILDNLVLTGRPKNVVSSQHVVISHSLSDPRSLPSPNWSSPRFWPIFLPPAYRQLTAYFPPRTDEANYYLGAR